MDHREQTKYRPYKVDEKNNQIILNDDYVPIEGEEDPGVISLPLEWGVCPTCQGNGSHVNPSIDSHGLSGEELADPDFREDYMNGNYDVPCNECGGRRVVATSNDPRFKKVMEEFWHQEAIDEKERRAESGLGY